MLTSDLFSPRAFTRIVRTTGPTDQRAGEAMSLLLLGSKRLGVVLLPVLPHPQDDCGDPAGQRELGQVRLSCQLAVRRW